MNEEKRTLDAGGLVAGLLLIAIGTIFLLDRLGYVDFHALHDYWPLLLVIFGLVRFTNRKHGRWSGIWLIIIGLWLQVTTVHWWGMTFDSSWPLLVIAFGAVMVARAVMNATEARHDH
jgi:hypothetical protein